MLSWLNRLEGSLNKGFLSTKRGKWGDVLEIRIFLNMEFCDVCDIKNICYALPVFTLKHFLLLGFLLSMIVIQEAYKWQKVVVTSLNCDLSEALYVIVVCINLNNVHNRFHFYYLQFKVLHWDFYVCIMKLVKWMCYKHWSYII